MVALKCPSCSANVEFDETRQKGYCTFCGTQVERTAAVNSLQDAASRGDILYALKEYDKARQAYKQATLEQPGDYRTWRGMLRMEFVGRCVIDKTTAFTKQTQALKYIDNALQVASNESAAKEELWKQVESGFGAAFRVEKAVLDRKIERVHQGVSSQQKAVPSTLDAVWLKSLRHQASCGVEYRKANRIKNIFTAIAWVLAALFIGILLLLFLVYVLLAQLNDIPISIGWMLADLLMAVIIVLPFGFFARKFKKRANGIREAEFQRLYHQAIAGEVARVQQKNMQEYLQKHMPPLERRMAGIIAYAQIVQQIAIRLGKNEQAQEIGKSIALMQQSLLS